MYLSDELIMEKLNSLSEHKMAKDIFVPLLKKKGLKSVKFTGGQSEEGIDIEYYENSMADNVKLYTGIQFKQGDITYSSRGCNGTVKEIKNQAEEAFSKDIYEVNSGGVHHLFRFIVATTGIINENARKMINKAKTKGDQTHISYWDSEKLAEDIRSFYEEEFIEYFDINEEENEQKVWNEESIVTTDYIKDNYEELIKKSNKCMRIFSSSQKEIIIAIINNYFENYSTVISISDLLYELETKEDYIRDDLISLQRLECIEIDCEEISLTGKACKLTELAKYIIDEMISADEYEENEEQAKEIFNSVVD